MEQSMKESHGKGVAIHPRPESCVGSREAIHRSVDNGLRCFTNERATQHLPTVLVGLPTAGALPVKIVSTALERARWAYNGQLLRSQKGRFRMTYSVGAQLIT